MFHAHKSQQGFGDTEIVEKERAGAALKERERERMEGRKRKKKKKTNSAPLPERQPIQSFLQSPLCFIFLPSHLLRIPSHSFKFFSRSRPLPAPLHPRCGLDRREAAPKAPRWRRLSPGCSARKVRPAEGSHQLLSTSADRLSKATRFLRVSPRG